MSKNTAGSACYSYYFYSAKTFQEEKLSFQTVENLLNNVLKICFLILFIFLCDDHAEIEGSVGLMSG
jgi:hypothetical protein